jgi:hypothetical protein
VAHDASVTTPDIEHEYLAQLAERREAVTRLDRLHARYGTVRLVLAGLAVAVVATVGLARPGWIAAVAAAFGLVALAHARLLDRRRTASAAAAFFEGGLRRMRHTWMTTGRAGDRYRPADHLYADDLDLFGPGSLFELLGTVRTRAGEETLARWLTAPMDAAWTRGRQTAVRELATRLDLRERLATIGDEVRTAVDAEVLRRWAAAPVPPGSVGLRFALAILAATTSTLTVIWLSTGWASVAALAAIVFQSAIAWSLRHRVAAVIASVEEPAHDLDVLASLLRLFERESFASPHLRAIADRLDRADPASRKIARLARLVAMLASRRNVLFAIPAAFLLWGTQWALAVDAWRRTAGRHIPEWLETVGELEVLVAIGGFAAEHPAHVFPEVVDGPPQLAATGLAHPTLGASAVGNDIELSSEARRLIIVSGSNMSGKSTWLRTLGATVVLAGLGAPVRASRCRLSPLAVGAAIRVHDSLADGRSRFFAEIVRLKAVLDLARDRRGEVLFLLDEILSGTNSHDRRVGAEALIRSLLAAGALGLVTTHDLAIGDIADRLDGLALNQHFADQFVDGTLRFDYRIAPGVVQTSNALALMRSIGLDV